MPVVQNSSSTSCVVWEKWTRVHRISNGVEMETEGRMKGNAQNFPYPSFERTNKKVVRQRGELSRIQEWMLFYPDFFCLFAMCAQTEARRSLRDLFVLLYARAMCTRFLLSNRSVSCVGFRSDNYNLPVRTVTRRIKLTMILVHSQMNFCYRKNILRCNVFLFANWQDVCSIKAETSQSVHERTPFPMANSGERRIEE